MHQCRSVRSLKLMAINYMQLLKDRGERSLVKNLKAVAEDLRTPVLLLSNLTRHADYRLDKRLKLSGLALLPGKHRTEMIEPYADIVLLTYKDKWAANTSRAPGFLDTAAEEITEVIVAKNRLGPIGIAKLRFDRRRGGFTS